MERGDKVELEENDVIVRMMNWEERARPYTGITDRVKVTSEKRKKSDNENEINSEETESDNRETEHESQGRSSKRQKLDAREKVRDSTQVPQVRKETIKDFLEGGQVDRKLKKMSGSIFL